MCASRINNYWNTHEAEYVYTRIGRGRFSVNAHFQNVASKATRVLNVLRRSMFGCDCEAKCRAYKAIVRPLLEYAWMVWSPHTIKDINLLEAVQRRVARWACNSRWDPVTFTWSACIKWRLLLQVVFTIFVCLTGLFVSLYSSGYSSHEHYLISNLLYLK